MSRKISLVIQIFESRMTRVGMSGNLVPIDTWVTMVTEYLPEKRFWYKWVLQEGVVITPITLTTINNIGALLKCFWDLGFWPDSP